MEELKLLVDMVANLPQMAMWVIAAFWAYKVVCIGSIYGVIRLAITKAHSWLTQPPHPEEKSIRPMLDSITIGDAKEPLIEQIKRLKTLGGRNGLYIHTSDVKWLREAIDEKLAREAEKS